MVVSNIRPLSYKYKGNCPKIPVNFFYKDGTPTSTFNIATLDSGAAGIAIPKWLADELKLILKKRKDKGESAGGKVDVYSTITDFNIGRSNVLVNYTDVEISVLETLGNHILIGMSPVFEDFIVEIDGYNKKFRLTPITANK